MLRSRAASLVAVLFLLQQAGCEEVGARRKIQEGNKLYYDNRYEEAIVDYDAALKVRPELAVGWFNLGLAHLALFRPGIKKPDNEAHALGAIEAFRKYMALQPNDVQARDYLLSTYIDSGHYEGALAYFEDRLSKNANDIEAVAQLAQINTQASKYDDAIRWHKKRVEMETSPDAKADSWYSIGVMNWRRLSNHPEVKSLDRARVADEGIAALQVAEGLRKDHGPTYAYTNLLYRERALASDASYARAVDTATAQVYYKRAVEIAKASASTQPATAPTP